MRFRHSKRGCYFRPVTRGTAGGRKYMQIDRISKFFSRYSGRNPHARQRLPFGKSSDDNRRGMQRAKKTYFARRAADRNRDGLPRYYSHT